MGESTVRPYPMISVKTRGPALRLLAAVGAVALLVAGCNSTPPQSFDLTAPRQARLGGGESVRGQIAISEPIAVQILDGDQIIVKDASGAVSYVPGGQWADRLPRLIQARLIQTFENGQRLYGISRPGGRVVADYQLNTELRAFQINSGTREGVVELSAKLVNDRTGRIMATRVFTGRAPVGVINGPGASDALDRALAGAMLDMVRWLTTRR